MSATFHELVQVGVPHERLVAAICRTLSAGEEAVVRAYVQAGYEVLPEAISERIAYREAQNRGQAITETSKRADVLIEALLNKVADEIGRATNTHGRMPKATAINARKVWDRIKL